MSNESRTSAAWRQEREGWWSAVLDRCEVKNVAGTEQCPDAAAYVLSRDEPIGKVCQHHLPEFLAMLTKRGPVTVEKAR